MSFYVKIKLLQAAYILYNDVEWNEPHTLGGVGKYSDSKLFFASGAIIIARLYLSGIQTKWSTYYSKKLSPNNVNITLKLKNWCI